MVTWFERMTKCVQAAGGGRLWGSLKIWTSQEIVRAPWRYIYISTSGNSYISLQRVVLGHYGIRTQELCESRGGRPGIPVPKKPDGFCGRKATLKRGKKKKKKIQTKKYGRHALTCSHDKCGIYTDIDPKFLIMVRQAFLWEVINTAIATDSLFTNNCAVYKLSDKLLHRSVCKWKGK